MALDRRYWIWDLVLLLALSTALRAHNLGVPGFCSEEAENALTARTYLTTGHLFLSESQTVANGLLYKWITSGVFRFFGESEWVARLPSAFLGTLTTLWVYLWASHWFGSWVGRCAGFLFAVWPWSVAWGRIGHFESLLAFLFVLLVVAAWKMLECNCLGHPLAEPPRVAGRKPISLRRILKLVPLLILALLAHFTSSYALFALFFLPGYLLIRLGWSWLRGKFVDSEFKRSLEYLLVGAMITSSSLLVLAYLDPGLLQQLRKILDSTIDPLCYLVYLQKQFGWVFAGFLVLGTGMALKNSRPGWLVFSAVWFPLVTQTLFSGSCLEGSIYYTFPFMVILVAMPIGWGAEMLKERVNHWFAPGIHWTWRGIAGLLALGLSVEMVLGNVFLSEMATARFVMGGTSSMACQVVDWRGMTDLIPRASNSNQIISTQAIPAFYYLGRLDYVFPMEEKEKVQINGTEIPGLRNLAELVTVLGKGRETWILGEKEKLKEIRRTPSGADLWSILTSPPSRVWEGPMEIVICYTRGR